MADLVFGEMSKLSLSNKMIFGLQEDISFPAVFIDGITRCGKSSLSKIIPSLTRMEHIQFPLDLELMIPALSLGGVSKDFARSYVRIYLNQLTYNLQLSRNVNFRKADQSGIFSFKEPKVYLDRLEVEEGKDIIKICRRRNKYIPFQTHDFLVNLIHVNNLGIKHKMLSLWRNPIDNIYSWWSRGWGERFYNGDPSSGKLLIENEYGDRFPWYCSSYMDDLSSFNPVELCVVVASDLIYRAIASYNNEATTGDVHLIFFEDLCSQPDNELSRICEFLDVEPTEHTEKAVSDSRFPRNLSQDDIDRKTEFFRKNVREEIFSDLIALHDYYIDRRYGLVHKK